MKALTWLKLFSSFFLMALLVIWAPAKVLAQDINFHHITQDQGTGFGNVWGILEDYEGFMWFATDDGLIRYDGYDLVTYRNKKDDPLSISANFAVVIMEDRYNQLWVGTLVVVSISMIAVQIVFGDLYIILMIRIHYHLTG
jgi:ligand-binding sensor domain-containing protein